MQAARGASTQTTAPNPFVAVVLLFPLHSASYLGIRTLGDLSVRAAAAACSLSVLAALAGIAFVAWTVVVAHNRNSRGTLPTAAAAAALVLAVAFAYARRSGWGFAMTVWPQSEW
jgi:cytochrome bd ubiquinol oxidase subunit II